MSNFVFNVSRLLAQHSGACRDEAVEAPRRVLDVHELVGSVRGEARLTRLQDAVLTSGCMRAVVRVPCARCDEDVQAEVEFELDDQFVPVTDQTRGVSVEVGDRWRLDPRHNLDLRDVLSEGVISAIPPRVVCGECCDSFQMRAGGGNSCSDPRLVELKRLRDEMFPEDRMSHG